MEKKHKTRKHKQNLKIEKRKKKSIKKHENQQKTKNKTENRETPSPPKN